MPVWRVAVVVFLVICMQAFAVAQAPASDTPQNPPAPQAPQESPDAKALRIGGGDLLDITVFGVPELSQKVRVNDSGDAYLALIGYVHVAGYTVAEAQAEIERQLARGGYVKDPHVTIFIAEYATQGVSVMGEVAKPGIYPVLGSRRLFDVIAAAGGLTDKSGTTVTIYHRDKPRDPIVVPLSTDPEKAADSNPEILPGDTIVVSKAGIVYVVGEVNRPSGLMMDKQGTLTLLQAVALAGGTTHSAALDHVRIVRQTKAGRQDITVELKKIMQGKAADMPLQAEDILFIPTSAGKNAAMRTMEAVIQMATGVSIRHF